MDEETARIVAALQDQIAAQSQAINEIRDFLEKLTASHATAHDIQQRTTKIIEMMMHRLPP